jgi:hypothetical protein
LNAHERRIISNVDEHGFFQSTVFDPDGVLPTFTYTVGFAKTLDCPEFIVFGLDGAFHSSMLWGVFRQIQAGKRPADNLLWSGLLEGHDCISRAVHPTQITREHFNSALWFHDHMAPEVAFTACQLVWPSAGSGLFPWDDGCPQDVRDLQPPLYLPSRAYS